MVKRAENFPHRRFEALSEAKRKILDGYKSELDSVKQQQDEYRQEKDKTSAEQTAYRDELQAVMANYDKASRIVSQNEAWIADARPRIEGSASSSVQLVSDRDSLKRRLEVGSK